MTDIASVATQGNFGDVTDRIAALGTQGIYREVVFVPSDILVMDIEINSAGGQISITRGDGIRIVGTRPDLDIV